jgi:hypothetical protein
MEYPTSGWVNFQSATLGQFCIGGNSRCGGTKPDGAERQIRDGADASLLSLSLSLSLSFKKGGLRGAVCTVPSWSYPLHRGSCRKALLTFLCPVRRSVQTIEAKLAKADGVLFASE